MGAVIPFDPRAAHRSRRKARAQAEQKAKLENSLNWCIERVRLADDRAKRYIVDYMLKVLLFKPDDPPKDGLPYRPKAKK
jgi:hypothetical protein